MKKILISLSLIILVTSWFYSQTTLKTPSGDEAINLVMSKNINNSFEYLVRPSYEAGSPLPRKVKTITGVGVPPLHALIFAVPTFFNLQSFFLAQSLAWLMYLIFLIYFYKTSKLINSQLAFATTFLLASNFYFSRHMLSIEMEPLMNLFSIISIYFFMSDKRKKHNRNLIASGIFFGLAFLSKLWLLAPTALFVFALGITTKKFKNLLLYFLVPASLSSISHLIFVSLNDPAMLSTWITDVYLGILNKQSIMGLKFSSSDYLAQWKHPWWYYILILIHENSILLVFVPSVLQYKKSFLSFRSKKNLILSFSLLLSFIILCVPKIKEPLYLLNLTPLLYLYALYIFKNNSLSYKTRVPTLFILMAVSFFSILIHRIAEQGAQLELFFMIVNPLLLIVLLLSTVLKLNLNLKNLILTIAFLCSSLSALLFMKEERDPFYKVSKFIKQNHAKNSTPRKKINYYAHTHTIYRYLLFSDKTGPKTHELSSNPSKYAHFYDFIIIHSGFVNSSRKLTRYLNNSSKWAKKDFFTKRKNKSAFVYYKRKLFSKK